ncbi:uridine kinase [Pigmentibacter sp. JX0631]|uniref:uridine kinase n=1 Tax=Pigmentibacter sp. JX0631 TaxID=2976982 RepID=UPI002468727B|nr:uridine kinase [Pigmentibacter sp. JX0631]WGL60387.1 uridine kinase [Pigmentibacter sp. JX0631]
MKNKKSSTVIAITGGSGSGKTTAARKLLKLFGKEQCQIISQDSYYFDHSKKFTGDGSVNFDHPNSIDFTLMANHIESLANGLQIEMPIYDFVTHTRKSETIQVMPSPFLIVDGILILSQEVLRPLFDISIFIDIPEDVRFQRRLKRDVEERGRSPEGVKVQYNSFVKPMHDQFVQPSRKFASYIAYDNDTVNNYLLTELVENLKN